MRVRVSHRPPTGGLQGPLFRSGCRVAATHMSWAHVHAGSTPATRTIFLALRDLWRGSSVGQYERTSCRAWVTLKWLHVISAASSKGRIEMARAKANILEKLREQVDFLRTSVRAFYEGNFAESV